MSDVPEKNLSVFGGNMKIVNFGSLNIDYVYTVPHFVRPGETLAAERRDIFPGGKGLNQTAALSRALGKASGIEIYIAGGIGKGDGALLKQALIDMNVNTSLLGEYDAPSGHTFIQVDVSGQNSIVYYPGTNKMHTKDFVDAVLAHFSKGDFIVLQNEINMLDYIIEKAHERGLKIFFNPSPFEKSILDLPLGFVDCFLVNEVEAADIACVPVGDGDELLRAVTEKFSKSSVVLTLGKNGVAYKDASGTYRHGIYNVPVVDTTAAGDTFTGYFIVCRALGMPVEKSLEYASKASSIAVSRKGAAPSIPTFDEVEKCTLALKK